MRAPRHPQGPDYGVYSVLETKKDLANEREVLEFFGSGGRDRTYDQLINSQLLYR